MTRVEARVADFVYDLKRADNFSAKIRHGQDKHGFCDVAGFFVDSGVKIGMIVRVVGDNRAIFANCAPDESGFFVDNNLFGARRRRRQKFVIPFVPTPKAGSVRVRQRSTEFREKFKHAQVTALPARVEAHFDIKSLHDGENIFKNFFRRSSVAHLKISLQKNFVADFGKRDIFVACGKKFFKRGKFVVVSAGRVVHEQNFFRLSGGGNF